MTTPCPSWQRPTGNGEREWQPDDRAWCDGVLWRRYVSPPIWTALEDPNTVDDEGFPVRLSSRTDAEMTAAGAVLVADADGPVAARAALAGAVVPRVPSFANPVPLTADLLAEHGGTLPDGTVIQHVVTERLEVVRGGGVVDRRGCGHEFGGPVAGFAEAGGWSVVHLGGTT